jgi:hypothetical protein
MNQPRAFANAKQVNDLTGISSGLLKYYRNSGKLKGYHLDGEREWVYRIDKVNELYQTDLSSRTRQKVTNLAIVNN